MTDLTPQQAKKLREDPALFVEKVIGKEPYPYQEKFLNSDSDRKVFVAGRQVGKTTVETWEAIHDFATKPGTTVLFIAPTQRQVFNFMEKLKAEISEWIKNPDEYGLEYITKSEIEGTNGSRIMGLPAANKGETIRGYTADTIIVDEAAFVDDEVYTSALRPMLFTTDGKFVLVGTPWGKEGFFYSKFDEANDPEKDSPWFAQRVTTMENPDVPSREIEEARRDLAQKEFEREILGQFTDKKNSFFKNKDINNALEWASESMEEGRIYPEKTGDVCYMGVDVASHGDAKAVFTSIDENGNVFNIDWEADCELAQVEGIIRHAISRHNYKEIVVEENGVGEGPVQRLSNEFSVVSPFRTTIRSKESIYNETNRELQSLKLKIPDLKELTKELRSIEYEKTKRGNLSISAPGDKNDDFADSLALAVAAKSDKSHVERMERAYTFQEASSANVSDSMKNKRAFSFGS